MVEDKRDGLSPAWLAIKMVIYTALFLAFALVALPYGADRLGESLFRRAENTWLIPGDIQRAVGGAIFGIGLIGYLVCSNWLVIVGRGPFVEFDPPTRFVSSGPYRWCRNPVAALLIVTVLGQAVYFGSVGIFALFALGFPVAQYQVTKIEEPRLAGRFGESYAEYCKTVPRWVPRPPQS